MRMMDVDRLVTVRRYAEERGIVKETVMSRMRRGLIQGVRIDGRIFIIDDKKEKEHEDNC